MTKRTVLSLVVLLALSMTAVPVLVACSSSSKSSTPTETAATKPAAAASPTVSKEPVTLTIFAAGTLSNPFTAIDKAFEAKYPNVTIHAQFGGSVAEVKQVTQLGMQADIVGVADFNVIPKYMFSKNGSKAYANWYIGFASNAITFVYTKNSKGADQINSSNWYKVLAQSGVEIGRSNPDTDPSGYQTLQMLKLAEQYYKQPGLSDAILKNAPQKNIRDTETALIGALQAGQIDYLAIYRSDAIQHNLKALDLPSAINLSDAAQAGTYATASVQTANGTLTASPIIYALTIPANAPNADWAQRWVEFALGPDGQKVLNDDGFGEVKPALASNLSALPQPLQGLSKQWPNK